MSGWLFHSRYMPCADCGASVERSAADAHACDPERRLEYQLFGLRDEIASFESRFHAFLESARGRFELWYAARERRRRRR